MTAAQAPVFQLPPHWLRGLAVFIAVGAGIYLGAIVWSGTGESLSAVRSLGLSTVVLGIALASSAYLVRFARWQWILRVLGHRLQPGFNLRVYLAGLALTSSPGKLGEAVRSVLLLNRGVRVSSSFAAFLTDRGSDVLGVAALGALAAWLAGAREPVLEVIFVVLFLVTLLAALGMRRGFFDTALSSLTRFSSWTGRLAAPLPAWALLWTPVRVVAFSLFAVLAYGIQALVFAFYVHEMGGGVPAAECVKIFAVAMLLGAASMVPGGLGATEAALVYQLHQSGMALPAAIAAAIALRLSTLWFAILLGVGALLTFAGRQKVIT
ncbi:MAG: YbhN family protein [Betaproteobacteria bacterium]